MLLSMVKKVVLISFILLTSCYSLTNLPNKKFHAEVPLYRIKIVMGLSLYSLIDKVAKDCPQKDFVISTIKEHDQMMIIEGHCWDWDKSEQPKSGINNK
jgi:hypothetical protein